SGGSAPRVSDSRRPDQRRIPDQHPGASRVPRRPAAYGIRRRASRRAALGAAAVRGRARGGRLRALRRRGGRDVLLDDAGRLRSLVAARGVGALMARPEPGRGADVTRGAAAGEFIVRDGDRIERLYAVASGDVTWVFHDGAVYEIASDADSTGR